MKDVVKPSRGLVELLAQSLVNPELRAAAIASPERLSDEYGLSAAETDVLRRTSGVTHGDDVASARINRMDDAASARINRMDEVAGARLHRMDHVAGARINRMDDVAGARINRSPEALAA